MSTLVKLNGVGLTYGSGATAVVAVHDATFSIVQHESLAITGASGSGKSSLLHLIAGLETPTRGTVVWPGLGGRPGADPTQVGVMFQAPSLIPSLDALENVALPLLIAGQGESEARTAAHGALELLELDWAATLLPEQLSGGQAQRIALARVLVMRPRIVVADEPTGQLDLATADHVLDTLLGVVAEIGAAVVVSTHDAHVAARFDGELVLRGGSIVKEKLTA